MIHQILSFLIYTWLASSALVLIAGAVMQFRTDSFDPMLRLFQGVTNAAIISIILGIIILIALVR